MKFTRAVDLHASRNARAARARARLVLTVGGAAAMFTACYDYSAPATPGVSPASEVRLTLTDLGSAELAAQVGPRIESVDGRVRRATADTIVLAVTRTVGRDGREAEWRGELVAVSTRQVATLRERRLSPVRTAVAVAAGVGVVVAALLVGKNSSEASTGGATLPGAAQ